MAKNRTSKFSVAGDGLFENVHIPSDTREEHQHMQDEKGGREVQVEQDVQETQQGVQKEQEAREAQNAQVEQEVQGTQGAQKEQETREVQNAQEEQDVQVEQEVQGTQGAQKEQEAREAQNAQEEQEAREAQNAQEEQDVQDVSEKEGKKLEYGTTQGKKGMHLKRINMAFSDDNHEYITNESRRRGMSATAFVNKIIENYKKGKVQKKDL